MSQMKLWQAAITGLLTAMLLAILPVVGACSADKPLYSSNEVVTILKQEQHLVENGSLEQDRYGARLVGKPVVANFRLGDWEAEYLGKGKWRVFAQASYYQGFQKERTICQWHFYETSASIEYVGNSEGSS